jgi:hypothetical protein
MSAHPMPGPDSTYVVPVSSGIFKHCAKIGVAVWVFLWMIDRTTKEIPTADGQAEGLVLNGRPIRAQEIALELQMGARTVQVHLDLLTRNGYLRRLEHGPGVASGYAVQRSKKWRTKLAVVEKKHPIETPQKTAEGAQDSASHNRKDNTHNTQTILVEDFLLDGEARSKSKKKSEVLPLVRDGWEYYLDRVGKSASQYRFAADRQKQGIEGFESLIVFAQQRESPDPRAAATELFRVAVDRLAKSPFHNGQNAGNNKYLDWHQLFRSKDFPSPRKLLEYWLDDSRWPA